MNEGQLASPARDYLRELDRVLIGVDATTAAELRGGIAESLQGLNEADAVTRIAELGDPAFVAASARDVHPIDATGSAEPHPTNTTPRTGTSSVAYLLSALAVYALAGFLLPVIGWIGGVVMLWASPTWRRGEKWAATLIPLVLCAVVIGFGLSAAFGAAAGIPRRFATYAEDPNPLLPGSYDVLWSSIVAAWLVLPLTASGVGVWLLVRGLMSTGRLQPASPRFAIAAALAFALGGFVLPVVGWFVGFAMVSASAIWRRWQKIVAAVVPIAAAVAAITVSATIAAQAPGIVDDPTGSFQVPNPLLAQPLLLQWNIPLALWPILPAAATLVAAWLLIEVQRRRSTQNPPSTA
ncbi:hypothetical protein [Microbacterium gorillae]|uniref:hypothetical protein n=1 Tax=Microbacterium gorillae TaxID=1231063 RepID=UPI003D99D7BC